MFKKNRLNLDPIWTFSRLVSQKPDQITTFGRSYCFKMGFVSRFIKSAHNLKSHFMYSCLHFMKNPDFWVISRPICPKNLISEPKQGHCKLRNEFCMIRVFWHLQNSCFRERTSFISLCMRKGRNGGENEEKNGKNSGPLMSLPVDHLMATDCNS